MEDVRECPVCRCMLASAKIRRINEWQVVICPECEVGVTTPRPTIDEIGSYYRDSFFSVRPDDTIFRLWHDFSNRRVDRKTFLLRFRRIFLEEIKVAYERCLMPKSRIVRGLLWPTRVALAATFDPVIVLAPKTPGRLLDIGFGRGEMMTRAKRLGWEACGVEVSQKSVDWGSEMALDVKRFDGSFSAPLPYEDESFDVVTMLNVLEHTHDPALAIQEGCRVLKPGGRLIVAVPNFEAVDIGRLGASWHQWELPQHLTFFRGKSLTRLLEDRGLENIDLRYKKWLNPITEKRGLAKSKAAAIENGTYSRAEHYKLALFIRFGKRLKYLTGKLSAAEVANGMCAYAVKPNGSRE